MRSPNCLRTSAHTVGDSGRIHANYSSTRDAVHPSNNREGGNDLHSHTFNLHRIYSSMSGFTLRGM